MNLNKLKVVGAFGYHSETEITFPHQGVVLITGKNGAGKSSIVECCGFALWGKTMRGTAPWNPGAENTSITVDCEVANTGVSVTANQASVRVSVDGKQMELFETKTKARSYLEKIVGPWDVWRKSSVFSSADSSLFTGASDGERKRLLEGMLGLECFDVALVRCREEKSDVTRALAENAKQRAILLERQAGFEALIRQAAELAGAAQGEPAASVDQIARSLEQHRQALMDRVTAYNLAVTSRDKHRDALQVATSKRRTAVYTHEQWLRGKICPTCKRPFEKADPAEGEALNAEAEVARTEEREVQASFIEAEKVVVELRSEVESLQRVERVQSAAVESAKGKQAQAQRAKRHVDNARAGLLDIEDQIDEIDLVDRQHNAKLVLLSTCEHALGLRGIRVQLLRDAVGALEQLANMWLAKLCDDRSFIQVGFLIQDNDRLELRVEGVGAGFGYKATSGGERRRIDIAVLLALGELAAASAGSGTGTLWFDEVFDALDDSGIDLAVAAIRELAASRCCVVISHNAKLAAQLNPALHLHVMSGEVVASI